MSESEDKWSTFHDDLVRPVEQRERVAEHRALNQSGPSSRTAGVDWDPQSGTGEIRTGPVAEAPGSWDDLLLRWNLDPNEVEVEGSVRRSSWEVMTKDGEVQTLHSFRANLRRKVNFRDGDFQDLLDRIKTHKPSKKKPEEGDKAYVVCSGDLQMGKEGSEATVDRFLASLSSGPARLKELRSQGRSIGPIFLPHLGDCIEHIQGHYASQTATVELSLTEQVRLIRRLAWKQIETYAPLTSRLVVPIVPGNHDEGVRSGGKQSSHISDSWTNDMASYLYDLTKANSKAYGHVEIVVPERRSLVITQDICGTLVAMAHGHQFPGGADGPERWWKDQAHGCQPAGDATILLCAHKHHLVVRQPGTKTLIQIPALDSGSDWFTAIRGQDAAPGVVTLVIGPEGWSDLAIL